MPTRIWRKETSSSTSAWGGLTWALSTVRSDALPSGVVEPQIAVALESAGPIYRAHLWDRHRRENAQWIEKYEPVIQNHSASVTKALAAALSVHKLAEAANPG